VIGLIAAGVAFAVLSVIGVLFVGGLALYAVTNGSAKGFLADVAAGDACNQATTALDVPAAGPDPVRAEVQARELESALEAADAAVGFDDTYEPLRDDIDAAQTAAQRIAELPQDPSTWTPVQRDRAVQEQAELEAISTRITNACSTIDVPFEDEFNGPTV
jgi:hypothetical protein